MEVSGQLHAPAALPPGKNPRYSLKEETRSVSQPVWARIKEKKSLSLPYQELNPGRPTQSLVIKLTELTQSPPSETDSYSPTEASPAFYGTAGSLSCSQQPATELNPEPDASSPHILVLFRQDPF